MLWIVVGLATVGIALFFIILKQKQNELEQDFQKRFTGKKIRFVDKYALFVAQASDGYSHRRGSGYLVLTNEELYFKRQLGNKVVSIPLHAILQVGETVRMGGQSPGKIMLKVDFKNAEGNPDAIAWCVKDRVQWQNQILALLEK